RRRCRSGPLPCTARDRRMTTLDSSAFDGSARETRDEIASGRRSAVDVCRSAIERMHALNPTLNAFNLIAADEALARAATIDRRRLAGDTLGPLAGVPIALKDNMSVRGMRTTASSRILENYIPPYNAT